MAKQQSMTTIELPSSSVVTSAATMSDVAQNHLQIQRGPSKQESQVADKTRLYLAQQIGHAILTEHATHLIGVIDQRAIARWVEFVEYDRSIREQSHHPLDQADIEAFNQAVRQGHANSALSLRMHAATIIEAHAIKSLEPEEEKQERRIIEQEPGLWGWLFGGQRVTRVVYE